MPAFTSFKVPSFETVTDFLLKIRGWVSEVASREIRQSVIEPVVRLPPTKASQYYVEAYLPPMPPPPTPVSFPEPVLLPELELTRYLPLLLFLLCFLVVASISGVAFYRRFLIEEDRREWAEAQKHTEVRFEHS